MGEQELSPQEGLLPCLVGATQQELLTERLWGVATNSSSSTMSDPEQLKARVLTPQVPSLP